MSLSTSFAKQTLLDQNAFGTYTLNYCSKCKETSFIPRTRATQQTRTLIIHYVKQHFISSTDPVTVEITHCYLSKECQIKSSNSWVEHKCRLERTSSCIEKCFANFCRCFCFCVEECLADELESLEHEASIDNKTLGRR